ncbi:uncharacterized protein EV154DRAFT_503189 [Mucor mucedo]|uniref:uncharacterized protein n=1 Tax=Mucor mucedo TaxID=29922 RepID=UPI00221ED502|nr:uncharacterized protein EV154DRAFT_503189 [Mucor mucedo]KAI7893077.1 hypothetical protein EV154DRAFT_503189 [Mucor mucedo]
MGQSEMSLLKSFAFFFILDLLSAIRRFKAHQLLLNGVQLNVFGAASFLFTRFDITLSIWYSVIVGLKDDALYPSSSQLLLYPLDTQLGYGLESVQASTQIST